SKREKIGSELNLKVDRPDFFQKIFDDLIAVVKSGKPPSSDVLVRFALYVRSADLVLDAVYLLQKIDRVAVSERQLLSDSIDASLKKLSSPDSFESGIRLLQMVQIYYTTLKFTNGQKIDGMKEMAESLRAEIAGSDSQERFDGALITFHKKYDSGILLKNYADLSGKYKATLDLARKKWEFELPESYASSLSGSGSKSGPKSGFTLRTLTVRTDVSEDELGELARLSGLCRVTAEKGERNAYITYSELLSRKLDLVTKKIAAAQARVQIIQADVELSRFAEVYSSSDILILGAHMKDYPMRERPRIDDLRRRGKDLLTKLAAGSLTDSDYFEFFADLKKVEQKALAYVSLCEQDSLITKYRDSVSTFQSLEREQVLFHFNTALKHIEDALDSVSLGDYASAEKSSTLAINAKADAFALYSQTSPARSFSRGADEGAGPDVALSKEAAQRYARESATSQFRDFKDFLSYYSSSQIAIFSQIFSGKRQDQATLSKVQESIRLAEASTFYVPSHSLLVRDPEGENFAGFQSNIRSSVMRGDLDRAKIRMEEFSTAAEASKFYSHAALMLGAVGAGAVGAVAAAPVFSILSTAVFFGFAVDNAITEYQTTGNVSAQNWAMVALSVLPLALAKGAAEYVSAAKQLEVLPDAFRYSTISTSYRLYAISLQLVNQEITGYFAYAGLSEGAELGTQAYTAFKDGRVSQGYLLLKQAGLSTFMGLLPLFHASHDPEVRAGALAAQSSAQADALMIAIASRARVASEAPVRSFGSESTPSSFRGAAVEAVEAVAAVGTPAEKFTQQQKLQKSLGQKAWEAYRSLWETLEQGARARGVSPEAGFSTPRVMKGIASLGITEAVRAVKARRAAATEVREKAAKFDEAEAARRAAQNLPKSSDLVPPARVVSHALEVTFGSEDHVSDSVKKKVDGARARHAMAEDRLKTETDKIKTELADIDARLKSSTDLSEKARVALETPSFALTPQERAAQTRQFSTFKEDVKELTTQKAAKEGELSAKTQDLGREVAKSRAELEAAERELIAVNDSVHLNGVVGAATRVQIAEMEVTAALGDARAATTKAAEVSARGGSVAEVAAAVSDVESKIDILYTARTDLEVAQKELVAAKTEQAGRIADLLKLLYEKRTTAKDDPHLRILRKLYSRLSNPNSSNSQEILAAIDQMAKSDPVLAAALRNVREPIRVLSRETKPGATGGQAAVEAGLRVDRTPGNLESDADVLVAVVQEDSHVKTEAAKKEAVVTALEINQIKTNRDSSVRKIDDRIVAERARADREIKKNPSKQAAIQAASDIEISSLESHALKVVSDADAKIAELEAKNAKLIADANLSDPLKSTSRLLGVEFNEIERAKLLIRLSERTKNPEQLSHHSVSLKSEYGLRVDGLRDPSSGTNPIISAIHAELATQARNLQLGVITGAEIESVDAIVSRVILSESGSRLAPMSDAAKAEGEAKQLPTVDTLIARLDPAQIPSEVKAFVDSTRTALNDHTEAIALVDKDKNLHDWKANIGVHETRDQARDVRDLPIIKPIKRGVTAVADFVASESPRLIPGLGFFAGRSGALKFNDTLAKRGLRRAVEQLSPLALYGAYYLLVSSRDEKREEEGRTQIAQDFGQYTRAKVSPVNARFVVDGPAGVEFYIDLPILRVPQSSPGQTSNMFRTTTVGGLEELLAKDGQPVQTGGTSNEFVDYSKLDVALNEGRVLVGMLPNINSKLAESAKAPKLLPLKDYEKLSPKDRDKKIKERADNPRFQLERMVISEGNLTRKDIHDYLHALYPASSAAPAHNHDTPDIVECLQLIGKHHGGKITAKDLEGMLRPRFRSTGVTRPYSYFVAKAFCRDTGVESDGDAEFLMKNPEIFKALFQLVVVDRVVPTAYVQDAITALRATDSAGSAVERLVEYGKFKEQEKSGNLVSALQEYFSALDLILEQPSPAKSVITAVERRIIESESGFRPVAKKFIQQANAEPERWAWVSVLEVNNVQSR
ncbi:hypothetical protein HZC07_02965, partial [Candidatus Micrarchaeota archaeon]|nr:hypothetical protein [Candidatus Micrarchaeota archaeon]